MQIIYILMIVVFIIALLVVIISSIINYKKQVLLSKISKEISDGYIIFNSQNKILTYNEAILKLFELNTYDIKNKNISAFLEKTKIDKDDIVKINEYCEKIKTTEDTISMDVNLVELNKIYKLEFKSVVENDMFMRYSIMCKDVTKTYQVIQELKENQDMMANREKFATLGQLVSGIVHSLKSPIFSLSGDLEALNSLIKEYEESIDDSSVTNQDHHDISKDMDDIIDKMKVQVENISDSITAIRSQVVTLNNDDVENEKFTVDELVKYIYVLTKNTLKQYLIVLNFVVRVRKNKEITGNLNALVQVVNNLIMNSVEAYEGKTNQIIDIVIDEVNKNLEISIIDTGKGIPLNIQNKLFKEIILADSDDKTGLGLFMAYSNIKAQFGGDIKFVSEEGKGSTFKVIIPLERKEI